MESITPTISYEKEKHLQKEKHLHPKTFACTQADKTKLAQKAEGSRFNIRV